MILDSHGREIVVARMGFIPAQPHPVPGKVETLADAVASREVGPDETEALEECKI